MPSANVSILNDVLGPVMRGPSSSHTAAAVRLGALARGFFDADVAVQVDYDAKGSLATTAESQGSNMGLAAGLLGISMDDPRMVDALKIVGKRGSTISYATSIQPIAEHGHPNTYRITMRSTLTDASHWLVGLSTGGGTLSLYSVDGVRVETRGDRYLCLLYQRGAHVGQGPQAPAANEPEGAHNGGNTSTSDPLLNSLLAARDTAGWVRVGRYPGRTILSPSTLETPPTTCPATAPHVGATIYFIESTAPLDVGAITEQYGAASPHGCVRVVHLPCVMPVPRPGVFDLPFRTVAEMRAYVAANPTPAAPLRARGASDTLCDGGGDTAPASWALWQLALLYESHRSGCAPDDIYARTTRLAEIYERGVREGLAGTSYSDRILGPQSQTLKALMLGPRDDDAAAASDGAEASPPGAGAPRELLDLGLLNTINLYASAYMEQKSAFGVIIAGPTAGSCGVVPGCLVAAQHVMRKSRDEVTRALLCAGIVGMFIATRSTFAAEEGGCQAECGAAGAMAAAGLASLQGGSITQCLGAASMTLQSLLGMVCDMIGQRVEAPCLLRNVAAASMAASSANLALASFTALLPFDEVLAAHWEVCQSLPASLCCTGHGGLANQPTARAIETHMATQCDGCSCGAIKPAHEVW